MEQERDPVGQPLQGNAHRSGLGEHLMIRHPPCQQRFLDLLAEEVALRFRQPPHVDAEGPDDADDRGNGQAELPEFGKDAEEFEVVLPNRCVERRHRDSERQHHRLQRLGIDGELC